MPFHRLILAVILSLYALAVMAPISHVQASTGPALTGSAGALLPGGQVQQTAMDIAQPVKSAQTSILDSFPFNSNCFNFCNGGSFNSCFNFCNRGFFNGCFNFCRPVITGCFNFFNFGCHSFSPSFFPFFNRFVFNRFNFNFNFGSMVNCVQIMRMPNGGTITVRVC